MQSVRQLDVLGLNCVQRLCLLLQPCSQLCNCRCHLLHLLLSRHRCRSRCSPCSTLDVDALVVFGGGPRDRRALGYPCRSRSASTSSTLSVSTRSLGRDSSWFRILFWIHSCSISRGYAFACRSLRAIALLLLLRSTPFFNQQCHPSAIVRSDARSQVAASSGMREGMLGNFGRQARELQPGAPLPQLRFISQRLIS